MEASNWGRGWRDTCLPHQESMAWWWYNPHAAECLGIHRLLQGRLISLNTRCFSIESFTQEFPRHRPHPRETREECGEVDGPWGQVKGNISQLRHSIIPLYFTNCHGLPANLLSVCVTARNSFTSPSFIHVSLNVDTVREPTSLKITSWLGISRVRQSHLGPNVHKELSTSCYTKKQTRNHQERIFPTCIRLWNSTQQFEVWTSWTIFEWTKNTLH